MVVVGGAVVVKGGTAVVDVAVLLVELPHAAVVNASAPRSHAAARLLIITYPDSHPKVDPREEPARRVGSFVTRLPTAGALPPNVGPWCGRAHNRDSPARLTSCSNGAEQRIVEIGTHARRSPPRRTVLDGMRELHPATHVTAGRARIPAATDGLCRDLWLCRGLWLCRRLGV